MIARKDMNPVMKRPSYGPITMTSIRDSPPTNGIGYQVRYYDLVNRKKKT